MTPFDVTVGKTLSENENADNQHFLLFQHCFPRYERHFFLFFSDVNFATAFNLFKAKVLSSDKRLICHFHWIWERLKNECCKT